MKYGVNIRFVDTAYIEVEADSREEAEEKAYEAIDNNEVELDHPYDDPDCELEIEELE